MRLTQKKLDACVEYASFDATSDRGDEALYKGIQGQHRVYLSREYWEGVAQRPTTVST